MWILPWMQFVIFFCFTEKQKEIVSRTVSVPDDLSTTFPPASTNLGTTASTSLTHSATTSQIDSLAQSRKSGTSKMVR